ncbi:YeiH family protein [Pseudomonas sp. N040]|uniref:YeiH family protein n=1 Tax=Pseudomonas sp. N040 TaxID=2785325 RepID=UPI0018A27E98|nr:putative sulfate exporter family transporter [Pseudomonas sp. N040]MBF7731574.1 putative sulfate exporter family transporter [Pseudomonas sp. N040]MBW7015218.1 putative sulfate exporter family transporter [Pseudomonas sp. N040]
MFDNFKTRAEAVFPGIAIALTIGFAASFLGEHYGAPAMLFALLLGMALNFLYQDPRSATGIEFSSRQILRFGVALLGFRIAFDDLLSIGWPVFGMIVAGVFSTILVGVLIARMMGYRPRFGMLTGGAVGICGASAALALSAVLPRDERNERATVFVVVGVTSLSTLAMIIYPVISAQFGLDDTAAGIFFGATIHDVAQVVGAGYSVSDTAGDIATLTKLLRVALLLPVVLMFAMIFSASREAGEKRPPLLPGFLVAFVVFAALNSLLELPVLFTDAMSSLSRICLVAAIAAIGLKSDLRSMLTIGFKPVLLMLLETVWLATFVLLGLYLLG